MHVFLLSVGEKKKPGGKGGRETEEGLGLLKV